MQSEKRARTKPGTTKSRVKSDKAVKSGLFRLKDGTSFKGVIKSYKGVKSGVSKSFKGAKSGVSRSRDTMSRLEARIPADIYKVIERAAELRGLTMTAYVTAIMGDDARRTISESSIIRLSRGDQIAFATALINPPEPNKKLFAAKRRHAALIRQ